MSVSSIFSGSTFHYNGISYNERFKAMSNAAKAGGATNEIYSEKMLKLKQQLEQLARGLENEIIDSEERPEGVKFSANVVGHYKLEKGTNAEIVKKLTGKDAAPYMPEGEEAFSEFEECKKDLNCNIWTTDAMDDIRTFFKKEDFARVIFLDDCLVGVTKDKQMIGIEVDASHMTEWDW